MTAQPFLLMVAGPNGSGKTTLTQQLRDEHVDLGVYINPDDIAKTLSGSYDERVAEAQRIADAQRQDCLKRRVSFSFETVMSHPSKIELLKQARTLGYFNILYFVATESPAFNIAHVRQRVALGGHDVPEDRITARYARAMALLPDAILQCDYGVLFDNSYRQAADAPVILAPIAELWRNEGVPGSFQVALGEAVALPDWARQALGTALPFWKQLFRAR